MDYIFKPITVDHYQQLHTIVLNNRVRLSTYFPNTIEEIKSLSAAKLYLENSDANRSLKKQYLFGIFHLDILIGYINVKNIDCKVSKCELGYFIDQTYEGQGIMKANIRNALNYCFEDLEFEKVYLRIAQENVGSIIIAEKNGFELEGTLRNEFKVQSGQLIDVLYYGLLRRDFKA